MRCVALVVGVVGVWLTPAVAVAQSPDGPVAGVVTRTDGGPVTQSVHVTGLYPSATHSVVFLLDGHASRQVRRIAVWVEDLRELEHGCNRPEARTPDTSCGAEEGELGAFVRLTVEPGIETFVQGRRGCHVTARGSSSGLLADVAAGDPLVAVLDEAVPTDQVPCAVATLHHEVRGPVDNLTQTDSVDFDLRLGFDGGVAAAVLGSVHERDVVPVDLVGAGGTLVMGLADTGRPLTGMLGWFLLLTGTGWGMLVVAHRRSVSGGQGVRA